MKWDVVPVRLHYLRQAINSCGNTRVLHFDDQLDAHVSFIENALPSQLVALENALVEFKRRRDRPTLETWLEHAEKGKPSEKNAAWMLRGLLFLFDELEHQVVIVGDCAVSKPAKNNQIGVLSQLPNEIAHLVEAALMVRAETEHEAIKFIDTCESEQLDRLRTTGRKVCACNEYAKVMAFLDEHPIEQFKECAWLYFLFAAMDYAGIDFDVVP